MKFIHVLVLIVLAGIGFLWFSAINSDQSEQSAINDAINATKEAASEAVEATANAIDSATESVSITVEEVVKEAEDVIQAVGETTQNIVDTKGESTEQITNNAVNQVGNGLNGATQSSGEPVSPITQEVDVLVDDSKELAPQAQEIELNIGKNSADQTADVLSKSAGVTATEITQETKLPEQLEEASDAVQAGDSLGTVQDSVDDAQGTIDNLDAETQEF